MEHRQYATISRDKRDLVIQAWQRGEPLEYFECEERQFSEDPEGLVEYSPEIGSVNREHVQILVPRICQSVAAHLSEGHQCVILLDGARFHQGLEFEGRISFRTLPPYSPFLNPVELAHSAFKAAVKRQLSQPVVLQEFALIIGGIGGNILSEEIIGSNKAFYVR